jgi:uncharacterized membrane protein YkoI
MNTRRPQHNPVFLRVGALTLAIVLVLGGSAALAWFLAGRGRDGDTGTAQPPAIQPSMTAAASHTPSASDGKQQTATALQAVATAERKVPDGKVFDLEADTEGGKRVWSAQVANPDDRQFNVTISQDGSRVLNTNEDKTPDDDIRRLRAAKVSLEDAVNTAAKQASGRGNVTSVEIDTTNGDTVVWQVEFGGDGGVKVLVGATSGEVLDVGPGVD